MADSDVAGRPDRAPDGRHHPRGKGQGVGPGSAAELGPLGPLLGRQAVVVLDGGLASQLEARGCDLDDPLWSARVLVERPDLVGEVHREYLEAGADCLISASYQATLPGLERRGLSREEAEEVLRRSVRLALEARASTSRKGRRRPRPLVAASVGPYGAYLADGSEFRGDYGLRLQELEDFHRRRFAVLATSGADLLACETLPSADEARALRRLLEESAERAWFSFSCRDGRHISDGTPLAEIAAELDDCRQILAVGVNCTPPRLVVSLVERLVEVTRKPIVVYPSSGERWEAAERRWEEGSRQADFAALAAEWHRAGARLIGGCCRTGPDDIRAIRRSLLG